MQCGEGRDREGNHWTEPWTSIQSRWTVQDSCVPRFLSLPHLIASCHISYNNSTVFPLTSSRIGSYKIRSSTRHDKTQARCSRLKHTYIRHDPPICMMYVACDAPLDACLLDHPRHYMCMCLAADNMWYLRTYQRWKKGKKTKTR